MKKYIYMLGIAACMSAACTNLDETIYSQLPKEEFFKSEAQLTTYSARPYTLLQNWGTEQSMWTLIMQLSNEVAVPKSYNGSWSEPRYREIQTHKMQTNNKLIRTAWEFCFNVIAGCNDVIYEVEKSGEMNAAKEKIVAEMKVLRAYCYLLAMDCWGNIPYSVDKKQEGYPDVKGRDFFFDFIELWSAYPGCRTLPACEAVPERQGLGRERNVGRSCRPMQSHHGRRSLPAHQNLQREFRSTQ